MLGSQGGEEHPECFAGEATERGADNEDGAEDAAWDGERNRNRSEDDLVDEEQQEVEED